MARADLHLHSRASTDTGSWFLRRAVLPESCTDPHRAYAEAKRRGMDFVTLSDHNTIAGALEIAHHPDVFVGVEVTTAFPEDRTPLHVLVWGLGEAQWDDLDRLRANVHEVVAYVEAAGLAHALAHPLQRLGAELIPDHVERCLLMFPVWEGRNGARTRTGNEVAVRIARSASREYLAKLADKHGLAPRADGPPSLVGGSDDHGMLDVAATWTETPEAASPAELLAHLRAGRTVPGGEHGSTRKLAHAMVSLAVTGYAERRGASVPPALSGIAAGLRGSGLGRVAELLEPLAAELALAVPHLGAAGYHAAERRFADRMAREFFGADLEPGGPVRTAMLTDTYAELNGVAGTMRRLSAYAERRADGAMTVVSCGPEPVEEPGHVAVRPLVEMPVPAYADASWRLGVPPLRTLVDLLEAREVEVIHAATPGPMGLAALLLAKVMGLPFVATHHTELGRYAMDLTGDRLAAGLTERLAGWFYGQAERVYVPSRATARGLVASGIGGERLALFTRGVDTDLFTPARRRARTRRRLGGEESTVLLYVGRLSREKGLGLLVEAVRRLDPVRPDLVLALVGDGPDRDDIDRALEGIPHPMLGPLTGEALAAAYASADLFCLPSVTETLGQVVLEAAASGLPAVVLDQGGACESVEHGRTGLVARAGDADDLAWTLRRLIDAPPLRRRLGAAARAAMLARPGWDDVFDGLTDSYADLRPSEPASLTGLGLRAWSALA